MERSKKRTAAVALATLAFSLVPASAIAEPGSDQYCDPFGGCGTDPGGQTGGGQSGKGRKGGSNQASSKSIAQIVEILESRSLNEKQRAAALAGADAAAVARYRTALRERQAQSVLEAAGLSALRTTVS